MLSLKHKSIIPIASTITPTNAGVCIPAPILGPAGSDTRHDTRQRCTCFFFPTSYWQTRLLQRYHHEMSSLTQHSSQSPQTNNTLPPLPQYVNVAILFIPTLWYIVDQILRIYFGLRPFKIKRMQVRLSPPCIDISTCTHVYKFTLRIRMPANANAHTYTCKAKEEENQKTITTKNK